jgi:hypothetical protein
VLSLPLVVVVINAAAVTALLRLVVSSWSREHPRS